MDGFQRGDVVAVYYRNGAEILEKATHKSYNDPEMVRMFIYEGEAPKSENPILTQKKFLFWKKEIITVGDKQFEGKWRIGSKEKKDAKAKKR